MKAIELKAKFQKQFGVDVDRIEGIRVIDTDGRQFVHMWDDIWHLWLDCPSCTLQQAVQVSTMAEANRAIAAWQFHDCDYGYHFILDTMCSMKRHLR